jgi:hypothetical protein
VAAGSGPPDRTCVIHHRTDELLVEQHTVSDGQAAPPVKENAPRYLWFTENRTHQGSVSLQSSSSSAAAAEKTTLETIVDAVSGKNQRRLLRSERKGSVAERMASPRFCQLPN